MIQNPSPLPRYEHEGFATSDQGLGIKRARLLVKVESLTRDSTSADWWPHAAASQKRVLAFMLADLQHEVTVYDRLVEDMRFDPQEP